jgi:hypothetical protein
MNHCFCFDQFQQTRESWQVVFFIAAGVYVFGAAAYIVLASGSLQPWAVLQSELEFKTVEVKPVTHSPTDKSNTSFELKPLSDDRTNSVTDSMLGNI